MMRRKRRRMMGLAFVATVVLATAWLLRESPVSVESVRVARGPLLVTIDEEGRTRVRDRFTVSAPVAGQLLRIAHRAGGQVRAGDVVARVAPAMAIPIDPRSRTQLQARLEAAVDARSEARARADGARAGRDSAARELERQHRLAEDALAPARDLEGAVTRDRQARADAEAATAALAVAEHEVENARAALLASRPDRSAATLVDVRAPCDGVVLRVFEESERVVPSGTPLVEIGAPSSLEIVADLLSTDAVQIRPGARVLIERWGGEGVLNGRVRLVEPSSFTKVSALGVEEQRVNVIVDFLDPYERWARLGDGFSVEVRVVTWEADQVMKAPTGALFRRGSSWALFEIEGGVAREREVTIGRQTGLEAEVRQGVSAGADVIVHPSDSIHDGMRVQSRR